MSKKRRKGKEDAETNYFSRSSLSILVFASLRKTFLNKKVASSFFCFQPKLTILTSAGVHECFHLEPVPGIDEVTPATARTALIYSHRLIRRAELLARRDTQKESCRSTAREQKAFQQWQVNVTRLDTNPGLSDEAKMLTTILCKRIFCWLRFFSSSQI